MPNETVPAIEQSPIQYQKIMDGKEVITAIKGYMLQAGNNVKGVLVDYGLSNTISTSILPDQFDKEFKNSVIAAIKQLDAGQTRIIIPVHLGNHFATVAIDTASNTAVIVEPTNAYKTEIAKLDKLVKEVLPGSNVQTSQTKIQDDGYSCGPIASKLAAHLLTCKEDLVTAIDAQHLPSVVYPLDTEEKKKVLVVDVQKAYQSKMDAIKRKDMEYDCAIQATVLGIFNLVATGQLDDAKYVETQNKLLKLYEAYLRKESRGTPVHIDNVTWPKFKAFLLQNDTEAKQQQLTETFTALWSGEFIAMLKNPPILHRFQNEMLSLLENEFTDFLANKPSDGKDKNYERFNYVKNIFIQLKNDAALSDVQAKTNAFKKWWNDLGKHRLFSEYTGTDDGKKFPNGFDLNVALAYLTNIDFDLGPDKDQMRNLYTKGYGIVRQNQLIHIFGTVDYSKIMTELCDKQNGILIKLVDKHNNDIYRFKKMSDEDRKNRMQAIIAKHIRDADEQQNYGNSLLDLVDPKQFYPTLALTRQGAQWGIIDTVPNTPWLKVKSFKAKLPEQTPANDERAVVPQNSVTAPKLDFTKANVKQKFKDICAEFKQKNAGKNYEVVSDDKMNINGEVVTVLSDGFEFTNVNKEIIEFCVKAMAEAFAHESINDQAQRVVKLTLMPKYEKFRKDYREELKKYNLTLEEDATNMLRPNGKWQGVHDQHNSEVQPSGVTQPSADTLSSSTPGSSATGQTAAPTSGNTPSVSNPAASTSTPTAGASPIKSPPLSGSATGSVAATTAPETQRPGSRR